MGGLCNDNSRLRAAAPPGVGVDSVILDGDVVPLVNSDPAVGAIADLVVVDVDVVTRPGHDPTANKLLCFDESLGLGLLESDVSIGTHNLQPGDLHTRDLTQFALIQISFCDKSNVDHDNATGSVKSEHGRMSGIVGEEDVSFVMNCDVTTKPLSMLSKLAFKSVKHYYKKETKALSVVP